MLPEAKSGATIRLHHGTDVKSANTLLRHGVDQTQAAAFNVTGEFWATTNATDAETFAQVNPAGGVPRRFSFDVPLWVLQTLLTANPPQAVRHTSSGVDWYEILSGGFPLLNQHMMDGQVVSPVP